MIKPQELDHTLIDGQEEVCVLQPGTLSAAIPAPPPGETAPASAPQSEDISFSITVLDKYALDMLGHESENTLMEGAALLKEPSIKAAVVDLRAANLRSARAEPFPTNIVVHFLLDVENIGGKDAANVTMAVYVGGNRIGTSGIGNVAAGEGHHLQVDIQCPQRGNFEVKMIVNPSGAIPERNRNNNSVKEIFTWGTPAGLSDLCAYAIDIAAKKFHTMQNVEFMSVVGNLGKTHLTNVECKIDVVRRASDETDEADGAVPPIIKEPLYFTIQSLGPGQLVQYNAKLVLKNAGSYSLRLTVDPNGRQPDANRANNMLDSDFIVNYDTHFGGANARWTDPSKIKVIVQKNVLDYISADDFVDAVQAWEGLAGVRFESIAMNPIVSTTDPTGKYAGYIRVNTYTAAEVDARAGAVAFSTYPSGNKGTIIRVNIDVFPNFNSPFALADAQKRTITHEVGHSLGLAHPFPKDNPELGCHDKAVMWQSKQEKFVTLDLTGHDIYNLEMRYR